MKKIIALVLALSVATPAAAENDDIIRFLGAIIAGAAIADALNDKDHRSEYHRPRHENRHSYNNHRTPSRHLEPGDHGWNPRVACYTRPEYRGNWVITRWYNCYDEVVRVEKHRRH